MEVEAYRRADTGRSSGFDEHAAHRDVAADLGHQVPQVGVVNADFGPHRNSWCGTALDSSGEFLRHTKAPRDEAVFATGSR
jgi:hypothetical protein